MGRCTVSSVKLFSIISTTLLLQWSQWSVNAAQVPEALRILAEVSSDASASHLSGPILEETGSRSSLLSRLSSHGAHSSIPLPPDNIGSTSHITKAERARILLGEALVEAQERGDGAQSRVLLLVMRSVRLVPALDFFQGLVILVFTVLGIALGLVLLPVILLHLALLVPVTTEERTLAAALLERDPAITRALQKDPDLERESKSTVTLAIDPQLAREIRVAYARAAEKDPELARAIALVLEAQVQAKMGRMMAKFTSVTPEQAAKGVKHAIPVGRAHTSSTSKFLEIGAEDAKCFICLEKYTDGGEIGMLKCGHHGDPVCLERWLKVYPSCPMCRRSA